MKNNYLTSLKETFFSLFVLVIFSLSFNVSAQTTVWYDLTAPGTVSEIPGLYRWTVPCGVTSVTTQIWGGGGAGGGSTVNGSGGSGGGSGGYSSKTFAVTPGDVFYYNIGDRGQGQVGLKGPDGSSTTLIFGVDSMVANGGVGGGVNGGAVGTGGSASGGDTNTSGNNGALGAAAGGVGGHSPATSSPDGRGGTGTTNANGNNASRPGAGGGGGEYSGANVKGGNGGMGRVQFVYTLTASPDMLVYGDSQLIVAGDVTPSASDHTDFGLGSTLTRTFTVSNTGGTALNISNINFSGTHAGDFQVTTDPNPVVSCGNNTTFVVTFLQGGDGLRSATLNIISDDPSSPYSFAIQATGISSNAEIEVRGNSTPIADGANAPDVSDYTDFGTLNERLFEINNIGSDVLNLLGTPEITISGVDANQFTISTFPVTKIIESAESVYFVVKFQPTSLGVKNAVISITSDDTDEATYTFAIRATATAPEIIITGSSTEIVSGDITPTTLDHTSFGNVFTSSSWVRTYRIANTGTMPLNLTGTPIISLTGSATFEVIQPSVAQILGNSILEFDVIFTPLDVLTYDATLSIANNDSNENPYTFAIQGTGIAGSANALPGCLGDSNPSCNNSSNSNFTDGLTGWTATNFNVKSNGTFDGSNAAWWGSPNPSTAGGSLSQALTGLTANSNQLLIKFKLYTNVQACSALGRSFNVNVSFGGTEYLTIAKADGQDTAPLSLKNGAFLVATSINQIRIGNLTSGGGCSALGEEAPVEIYLSIPKGLGVTTGSLAFTINNAASGGGGANINHMRVYFDDIEISADATACGFLWLKADAGTSTTTNGATVQTWNDNNNVDPRNATQATASRRPTYETSVLNFNPGLYFDGANATDTNRDLLVGTGNYSSSTQIVVFKSPSLITSATGSQTLIGNNVLGDASDVTGLKLGNFSSSIASEVFGIIRGTNATGFSNGTTTAFASLANIAGTYTNSSSPPTGWATNVNGNTSAVISGGTEVYRDWANRAYTIAASPNVAGSAWSNYFTGHILEVATYPARLNSTELQKVYTYLALKYGITLGHNYTRGNGAIVYTVADFPNRVFGIGREDCQAFHQRQSISESDTTERMLTIGYNATIGTTNSTANGNDLVNGTFLVMGDNSADRTTWTVTNAPTAEISEATRITRVWKAQVAGSINAAPIRFRLDETKLPSAGVMGSAERVAMVVSTSVADIPNATLSNTSRIILPMTKVGTNWERDYTFPDTQTRYITFIKYNDCYTDLQCVDGTTTWNGTTWSNGTPTPKLRAIINGVYETGVDGDFHCCRLEVNNVLSIHDGGLVEVESDIVNNGSIVIANNGGLMQYYDSATNTGNGTISLTRVSVPKYKFDYTYWSSPVVGFNLSAFNSPAVYVRNAVDDVWSRASGAMEPGKGYIAMTDNNSKDNAVAKSITFSGTLNNGRINQTVYTEANKWNLVGNPYPCALDADEFLSDPVNSTRIEGGLYFWTHNTRISGFASNRGFFNENDYAIYTISGGVGTSTAKTFDPLNQIPGFVYGGGNNASPNGYVASGQAFFVEAKSNNVPITFKNCMRAKAPELNNQFYKSTEVKSNVKDRYWLDIISETGSFKQILVGYFKDATDWDDRYDASTLRGNNTVTLYSIINDESSQEEKSLAIQGRKLGSTFNDNDKVKLGYTLSGSPCRNIIDLAEVEGLFVDKDVILIDKQMGVRHNLKEKPYLFSSELGEFNDRFEITYSSKPEPVSNVGGALSGIVVSSGSGKISISTKESAINTIKIYNVLGALIYESNVEGKSQAHDILSITPKNQVLIVVTTLANGEKSTSKIIY